MLTSDIGAYVNLMDDRLLNRIFKEGGNVEARTLAKPRSLNVAVEKNENSEPVQVIIEKIATMPVELQIRQAREVVGTPKPSLEHYQTRL